MPKVCHVLSRKGSHVLTISPNATVLDAALLMNEHKVGALVVTQANRVVGIVTERDVLQRVVAQRLDPAQARIANVMTVDVICCEPDCSLDDARNIFMSRRVRHLPIVDPRGALVGMVSIGDVNAHDLNGAQRTIHYLHEYLYGQQQ